MPGTLDNMYTCEGKGTLITKSLKISDLLLLKLNFPTRFPLPGTPSLPISQVFSHIALYYE